MKFFRFISVLIVVVVICFGGCTKQGAQGPKGVQGEKGDTGLIGLQGDSGPQGEPGETGSVDVFYSDWMNVSFTLEEDGLYYGEINEPKINQDILDNGTVLVYVFYKQSLYYKLPLKGGYTSSSMVIPMFSLGKITIISNLEKNTTSATTWRYIIIPGHNLARSSSPLPDYNNYYNVCKYYNIPK